MPRESNGKQRILFFSFVGRNYSRSSVILNFESENFHKDFFKLPTGIVRFSRAIFQDRHEIRKADFLVVMSPCHIIVPALKLFTGKKVILDAGWSLTDGQLSRSIRNTFGWKLLRSYFLDFIAFHAADKLVLETEIQGIRTRRIFLVPRRKIEVNWTGLDETVFFAQMKLSQNIDNLDAEIKKRKFSLIVLFRGKVNSESGIDHILEAAELLGEKVLFILVCGPRDEFSTLPPNVILLSDLTNMELREVYQKCDVALGQISTHPRLKYTIPHKAFEAGFFAKPYITANSTGIRELYGPESAVFLEQVSGQNLASEILRFLEPTTRKRFGKSIQACYKRKAAQTVTNLKFEDILKNL